MTILAIDPGLSGAYAFLSGHALTTAGDLPRLGDGSQSRISGALFASVVKELEPKAAILEAVSAMPGQGVSSMFRFGRACGSVEGILAALGVPIHFVTPGKWKGHFHLTGKADGGAEASRQRAIELWPECAALFARKKDHNRAEAALIGLWFISQPQNQRPTGGTRGSEAGHFLENLEARTGGG